MNALKSVFLPRGFGSLTRSVAMQQAALLSRAASCWVLSREPAASEGPAIFQNLPWRLQQVRGVARGNEYQPKNIKRMRTHGWTRRLRSRGGIQVLLRRMLKGRESLSVWQPSDRSHLRTT